MIAKSPPHTRYMAVIGLDGFRPANQIVNEFDTRPICEYILGVNYGSGSSIAGPDGLKDICVSECSPQSGCCCLSLNQRKQ